MFFGIKKELANFLKRRGVALGLEEQNVKANWQSIIKGVNRSAVGKSNPLYITKDKVLVVRVENNMWMQELSFLKENIKKEINRKSPIVEDIKFIS